MRFAEALADLEARQPERIVPDLDRIIALTELLDHPEQAYPTIHVAGTNGKTTTTRLIGRILCAHGLSAGVYTSPHLHSVTERLALCEEAIPEEEFAEAYDHLRPYLEEVDRNGERVTYFETLTALAFLWFTEKPVDAGVFEVGMGGRWDATNVVRSQVAVICSIDLDHPELGSTIEEVAREKAAIIKEGSTVVVQDTGPAEMAAVRERAAEVGAPVMVLGQDFRIPARGAAVGGQQFGVSGIHGRYGDLFLPLHGAHQATNVATAIAASESFMGRALSGEAVREALAGATAPGRLEVVSRKPLVVMDGAHNPEAAGALAASLGEAFVWRRLHLVLGILSTKDVDGVVEPLGSRSDHAYTCANSNPASFPPEAVAEACRRAGLDATPYPTVDEALDAAVAAATEEDLILVTGSLYTVADARRRYVERVGG
ncbi:MAG: bifunctional folylpolyglutamate synthase/dihydrofolate synthase [Actinomycetota bacterium]